MTYAAYDVYCTNHDWNTLDKILELDAPSYYTDIATYASEMVLKFITGIEPLTRESYNAYVKHIRDMGIDHCLEIYQTAYERYLER